MSICKMSWLIEMKEKNKKEVNEVLLQFSSDSICKQTLYNRCKSIIDHDEWYTEEQRHQIYIEASKCTLFSTKQKNSLSYSSIIKHEDEDYDDGATSDENRRWRD